MTQNHQKITSTPPLPHRHQVVTTNRKGDFDVNFEQNFKARLLESIMENVSQAVHVYLQGSKEVLSKLWMYHEFAEIIYLLP